MLPKTWQTYLLCVLIAVLLVPLVIRFHFSLTRSFYYLMRRFVFGVRHPISDTRAREIAQAAAKDHGWPWREPVQVTWSLRDYCVCIQDSDEKSFEIWVDASGKITDARFCSE